MRIKYIVISFLYCLNLTNILVCQKLQKQLKNYNHHLCFMLHKPEKYTIAQQAAERYALLRKKQEKLQQLKLAQLYICKQHLMEKRKKQEELIMQQQKELEAIRLAQEEECRKKEEEMRLAHQKCLAQEKQKELERLRLAQIKAQQEKERKEQAEIKKRKIAQLVSAYEKAIWKKCKQEEYVQEREKERLTAEVLRNNKKALLAEKQKKKQLAQQEADKKRVEQMVAKLEMRLFQQRCVLQKQQEQTAMQLLLKQEQEEECALLAQMRAEEEKSLREQYSCAMKDLGDCPVDLGLPTVISMRRRMQNIGRKCCATHKKIASL